MTNEAAAADVIVGWFQDQFPHDAAEVAAAYAAGLPRQLVAEVRFRGEILSAATVPGVGSFPQHVGWLTDQLLAKAWAVDAEQRLQIGSQIGS